MLQSPLPAVLVMRAKGLGLKKKIGLKVWGLGFSFVVAVVAGSGVRVKKKWFIV